MSDSFEPPKSASTFVNVCEVLIILAAVAALVSLKSDSLFPLFSSIGLLVLLILVRCFARVARDVAAYLRAIAEASTFLAERTGQQKKD